MDNNQENLERPSKEEMGKQLPSSREYYQERLSDATNSGRYFEPLQLKRRSAREYASMARQEAGDQIKKLIAQKTRQALVQAARSAAIALWSSITAVIGPYAAVIVICILLIAITAVPAIAMWNKAKKGVYGNSGLQEASASDIISLGESFTLSQPIGSWYYSQCGEEWKDFRPADFDHTLCETGCVVTSYAMMAKYYGVNITPRQVPDLCGGNGEDSGCMSREILKLVNKTGKNMKWVSIKKGTSSTLPQIQEYLKKGYPVMARGNTAFGASSFHNVIIVSYDEAKNSLILNDPAFGSGHRSSWSYDSQHLEYLQALVPAN